MSTTIEYSKNINKNYLFVFLRSLDFTQGIWMIYLAFRGLSLAELGMLEGFFHLMSFSMEVPTGIIADIYGRKFSRILGRIFSVFGTLLMIFSSTFIGYLLAFAVSALSYNLESGAGTALVYDSLKKCNKEKEYMKIMGREELIYQVSQVIAMLLGGYLATINYIYVFYLTGIIGVISIIQATRFKEPILENKNINKLQNPLLLMRSQFKSSCKVIKETPKIAVFIIFVEYISAINACFHYYLQNYWKSEGYSEFYMGIIFTITGVLGAILATQVYKLEKKLGDRKLIIGTSSFMIVFILVIGWTKFSQVGYIGTMVLEVILFVATGAYINELIPSENRASIISFQSMAYSFIMLILFPIVGKISDIYSLKIGFMIISILAFLGISLNNLLLLPYLKIPKK